MNFDRFFLTKELLEQEKIEELKFINENMN